MNMQEIEFFNVGEVESISGLGAQCLTRIPRSVRDQLNQRARITGMDSVGCEPEEFEERAAYAIRRFAASGKPVLVTNIFPNSCTVGFTVDEERRECRREQVFDRLVEELVRDCAGDNLHFVPGSAILDDFSGLSSDLLHPCAYGHAVMAGNLARELKRIL